MILKNQVETMPKLFNFLLDFQLGLKNLRKNVKNVEALHDKFIANFPSVLDVHVLNVLVPSDFQHYTLGLGTRISVP